MLGHWTSLRGTNVLIVIASLALLRVGYNRLLTFHLLILSWLFSLCYYPSVYCHLLRDLYWRSNAWGYHIMVCLSAKVWIQINQLHLYISILKYLVIAKEKRLTMKMYVRVQRSNPQQWKAERSCGVLKKGCWENEYMGRQKACELNQHDSLGLRWRWEGPWG